MATNTNTQFEDQMAHITQYYPRIYDQLPPEQEEAVKPKRRRRREKAGASSNGARKRKLSEEQVKLLEQYFEKEHKLDTERKKMLASELGLDPRQVAVWFQNRRARLKIKKLEEEYSNLKSGHDSTLVEKFTLENEVLKLKEQLAEAGKEINRLMERWDGNSSTSPSSSLSMEAMEPRSLWDLGMEGLENIFYLPEDNYIQHGLEWLNI